METGESDERDEADEKQTQWNLSWIKRDDRMKLNESTG